MSPTVTWKCSTCGLEIEDGKGWVQLRMSELGDHEEAVREWEAAKPGHARTFDELMAHPEAVHWRALHAACDSSDGEPYAIGVEDLRTPWDLVNWTVQLLEKTWLRSTDWREVLRSKHREAGGSGSV